MMSGNISAIAIPIMTAALTPLGTTVTSDMFTLPGKETTIIIPEYDVTIIGPEGTDTATVEEQTSNMYPQQCVRRSGPPYYGSLTSEPSPITGYEDCRTWGCFPGTICVPLDRCDTEPAPEQSYLCQPERCRPAPPVIEPQRYRPGMSLRNVTLQLPYFPIDPTVFGLDNRIWYPIIGQESLSARGGGSQMTNFEKGKRKLASRQVLIEEVTGLGACIQPCNAAVVERQHAGLTGTLCSADGAYHDWFMQCRQCTSDSGPEGVDLYRSVIYPTYFVTDVDYCRANLPGVWLPLTSSSTTIATSTATGPIETMETTRSAVTTSSRQVVSTGSLLTTVQSITTTNATVSDTTTVMTTSQTTKMTIGTTTGQTTRTVVETPTTQSPSITRTSLEVRSSTPTPPTTATTATTALTTGSTSSKAEGTTPTKAAAAAAGNPTMSAIRVHEVLEGAGDGPNQTSPPTTYSTTNSAITSSRTPSTETVSETSYSSIGGGYPQDTEDGNDSPWVSIVSQSGNAVELALYHGSPRHQQVITYFLAGVVGIIVMMV